MKAAGQLYKSGRFCVFMKKTDDFPFNYQYFIVYLLQRGRDKPLLLILLKETAMTRVILVLVLAVLAVAFLIKRHKHAKDFSNEEVIRIVKSIFSEARRRRMSKDEFIKALKRKFHCTSKEAVYLVGKARTLKLIGVEHHDVMLL